MAYNKLKNVLDDLLKALRPEGRFSEPGDAEEVSKETYVKLIKRARNSNTQSKVVAMAIEDVENRYKVRIVHNVLPFSFITAHQTSPKKRNLLNII